MKVCIISRGDLSLFPPTQGASNKLYYTIKTLSELDVTTFFVSAEDDFYLVAKNGKFRRKSYPVALKGFEDNEKIKQILSIFGIPPDVFPIYHPVFNSKLFARLLYVVNKENVDVIQAEFTCFGIPALLVKFLTGTPVCTVLHNIETYQIPSITKLSKNGKEIVRSVEKFVCKYSDRVVVVSKEEKERVVSLGIRKNKIEIIPFGVNLEWFGVDEKDVRKIRNKLGLRYPTLVYHGTYSYKPNRDAVIFIAKKVLPYLRKRGINANLLAIGEYPFEINDESVIFTGVVKDLPKYLKAADIAVAPIVSGGGMRIKILEYFASKVPVVATDFAVEGIPVKNGKHVLISDLKKMPKMVEKLINDKKLQEKMAKNAYEIIKRWDWKKIMKMHIDMYKKLVKK